MVNVENLNMKRIEPPSALDRDQRNSIILLDYLADRTSYTSIPPWPFTFTVSRGSQRNSSLISS